MPRRNTHRAFASAAACGVVVSFSVLARADLPVGYKGKPFDPAVAGGPKLPPGTKGGPYAIPGRLDFVNYDLGGDGVGYHQSEHAQRGGAGYRIDTPPTATLSLTSDCIPNGGGPPCQNVWYDTSPTLDGTVYPTPTTADFSVGAVHVGDWFNFTVNVETTGTYSLSSTWATGSGPPGGEGGNGDMGLSVFSNGTKLATWTAVFPNFNMYADYHHWVAYPSFASVTLAAGPQVIQLYSEATALQLDYVQFALVTGDGGLDSGDGGAAGSAANDASASSGSTASGSSGGQSGATTNASGSASGSLSTSGAVSTSGMTSPTNGTASGTGTSTGTIPSGTTSGAAAPSTGSSASPPTGAQGHTSSGCALAPARRTPGLAFAFALLAASLARLRNRRRFPIITDGSRIASRSS
jgi:hypothetical protein